MGQTDQFGLETEGLGTGGLDRYIQALSEEHADLSEEDRKESESFRKEAKAETEKQNLVESTKEELRGRFRILPQFGDEGKVDYIANALVDHLEVTNEQQAYDRIRRLHARATSTGTRMAPLDSILRSMKTELSRRGIE